MNNNNYADTSILTNLGPVMTMGVKAFHQLMLAGGTLVGGAQSSIVEVPITATVSDGCSSKVVEITVRRQTNVKGVIGKARQNTGNLQGSIATNDSRL